MVSTPGATGNNEQQRASQRLRATPARSLHSTFLLCAAPSSSLCVAVHCRCATAATKEHRSKSHSLGVILEGDQLTDSGLSVTFKSSPHTHSQHPHGDAAGGDERRRPPSRVSSTNQNSPCATLMLCLLHVCRGTAADQGVRPHSQRGRCSQVHARRSESLLVRPDESRAQNARFEHGRRRSWAIMRSTQPVCVHPARLLTFVPSLLLC